METARLGRYIEPTESFSALENRVVLPEEIESGQVQMKLVLCWSRGEAHMLRLRKNRPSLWESAGSLILSKDDRFLKVAGAREASGCGII